MYARGFQHHSEVYEQKSDAEISCKKNKNKQLSSLSSQQALAVNTLSESLSGQHILAKLAHFICEVSEQSVFLNVLSEILSCQLVFAKWLGLMNIYEFDFKVLSEILSGQLMYANWLDLMKIYEFDFIYEFGC